jgi:hypothetical protein
MGRDIVGEHLDTHLGVEVHHFNPTLTQPIHTPGKIDRLANHDFPNAKLAHQPATIPHGARVVTMIVSR